MKKTILLIVFAAALPAGLFAEARQTFTGTRTMAMGNANLAGTDDASAMLINPAALDLYLDHMHLTVNFGFYLSPAILDLSVFVANHAKKLNPDGMKKLDDKFYNDLYSIDSKWGTIGLLPNVGFMARTYGLTYGAYYYWEIPTQIMMESGVLVPKIFVGTKMDQILTGSVAKRFGKYLSLGGSAKIIDRYTVDELALGYAETMEFKERYEKDKLGVLDPYLSHGYGFGLDGGALFHFGALRVGTTLQDAFTYVDGDIELPRWSIGSAYKILSLMELPFVDDMMFTLDIRDILYNSHFFTKLNLGGEVRLNNVDVRAGLNQGYFTFGTSVKLLFITMDYLYFAQELGKYPNEQPLAYHLVQLGIDIKF